MSKTPLFSGSPRSRTPWSHRHLEVSSLPYESLKRCWLPYVINYACLGFPYGDRLLSYATTRESSKTPVSQNLRCLNDTMRLTTILFGRPPPQAFYVSERKTVTRTLLTFSPSPSRAPAGMIYSPKLDIPPCSVSLSRRIDVSPLLTQPPVIRPRALNSLADSPLSHRMGHGDRLNPADRGEGRKCKVIWVTPGPALTLRVLHVLSSITFRYPRFILITACIIAFLTVYLDPRL